MTSAQGVVLFGTQATLSHDVWRIIISHCSWFDRAQFARINKSTANFANFSDDLYNLYRLLHMFRATPKKHLQIFLPRLSFVKNVAFAMIRELMPDEHDLMFDDENQISNEPMVQYILTRIGLQLHKYSNVVYHDAVNASTAMEDLMVCLMKYLPWRPYPFLDHPYAKVKQMALVGVQLLKLQHAQELTMEKVIQFVPNYEDYACCLITTSGNLFGKLIASTVKQWDEQCMLCALRTDRMAIPPSNTSFKFKNPETITFMLHSPMFLRYLDPELFNNLSFVRKAIIQQPELLRYAPESLRDDELLLEYTIANCKREALLYASYRLQCKYFGHFLFACRKAPSHYKLPMEWSDNGQVATVFLAQGYDNFSRASVRLQNHEPFVLKSLSHDIRVFRSVPKLLQRSPNVLHSILCKSWLNIIYVPIDIIDGNPQLLFIHQRNIKYRMQGTKSEFRFISFDNWFNLENPNFNLGSIVVK